MLKSKDGIAGPREVICWDDADRRNRIISLSHAEGHHGVQREYRFISERYAGISRDHVAEYIRSCTHCMKFEPIPKTEPLRPIIAKKPFERLQIDLIDLKSHAARNSGYAYVANMVDCFSRYSFTKAIKEKSAEEVLKFLQETFSVFGFPAILQSDNGKEFKNALISQFCNDNRVRMVHGRPRHPQSQGKVERLNQTLARSLGKCCDSETPVWIDKLEVVTKRYNLAVHSAFNETPFFAFFGRNFHSAQVPFHENEENLIDEAEERSDQSDLSFFLDQGDVGEEPFSDSSAQGNPNMEFDILPDDSAIQHVETHFGLVESQQEQLSQKNDRYCSKMVKKSSVHARKSHIEVNDQVVIKDDHDANPGTKRKKLKPLNSRIGKVLEIKANNSYEVEINGERLNFRSNQLRKVWNDLSRATEPKDQ